MKSRILILSIVSFAAALAGCTTAQLQAVESQAVVAAQTASNVLETANVATGGVFTTALANYALKQTHNTGDEAIVDAAIAQATALQKIQLAAKSAGVTSPTGLQAVATAALSSPDIINVGAAAVPASATASTAPTP